MAVGGEPGEVAVEQEHRPAAEDRGGHVVADRVELPARLLHGLQAEASGVVVAPQGTSDVRLCGRWALEPTTNGLRVAGLDIQLYGCTLCE